MVDLINGALGQGHFVFEGSRSNEDFVFSRGGLEIPFRSLSDGYRAFLGWVEWMNINRLRLDSQHRTGVDSFQQPIHGLDDVTSVLFCLNDGLSLSGSSSNACSRLTTAVRSSVRRGRRWPIT